MHTQAKNLERRDSIDQVADTLVVEIEQVQAQAAIDSEVAVVPVSAHCKSQVFLPTDIPGREQ